MPAKTNNPLGEIAATVVAADPELRASVSKLVRRLVREAERTLDFGSPADRAALMKAVVPTMLRSIQSADADAGDRALTDAYERMMAELRGDLGKTA